MESLKGLTDWWRDRFRDRSTSLIRGSKFSITSQSASAVPLKQSTGTVGGNNPGLTDGDHSFNGDIIHGPTAIRHHFDDTSPVGSPLQKAFPVGSFWYVKGAPATHIVFVCVDQGAGTWVNIA